MELPELGRQVLLGKILEAQTLARLDAAALCFLFPGPRITLLETLPRLDLLRRLVSLQL